MNQIAMLVYGMLTLVFAFVQAAVLGSPAGMLAAVAAAGVTYVFQAVQEFMPRASKVISILWLLIIVLTLLAGVSPYVFRI